MASNKTVTYVDIDLNSVEDYWETIVVPDVRDFAANAEPRTVLRAASSVWHLHDWVWHHRNVGQDSSGPKFQAYRNELIAACPELGWLRDVTDAGKHRGLGRMPEVTEAKPRRIRVASLPLLLNTIEVSIYVLVFSDDSHENFAQVLERTVKHWLSELPGMSLSSPYP